MHLSHDLKLLEDGLSTVAYTVLKTEKNPLYTRILVRLPKPEQLLKKDLYIADSGKALELSNNIQNQSGVGFLHGKKNVELP